MKTPTSNAVITLESLAHRLEDLAARALDPRDRFTDETDRDVRIQLQTWMTVADNCVWACETDYDDQPGLIKLQRAQTRASAAWNALRSKEPAYLVKLGPKSYFHFVAEGGAVITTKDLATAWTAGTELRAKQYAEDLRKNHAQSTAKAVSISGAQMERARHRLSPGPNGKLEASGSPQ